MTSASGRTRAFLSLASYHHTASCSAVGSRLNTFTRSTHAESAEPLHLPRLISLLLVLATSICVIGTCAWQLQKSVSLSQFRKFLTSHSLHDKRERARRTFPGGRLHVTDNVSLLPEANTALISCGRSSRLP
jgi:hypothetical protein